MSAPAAGPGCPSVACEGGCTAASCRCEPCACPRCIHYATRAGAALREAQAHRAAAGDRLFRYAGDGSLGARLELVVGIPTRELPLFRPAELEPDPADLVLFDLD